MYLPSGEMAALDALPVDVIRLTLILRNGVVLFHLKRAYRPNDKPATTIRAATTNIVIRLRRLNRVSCAALVAVGWPARPSAVCVSSWVPVLVAGWFSNEDDSAGDTAGAPLETTESLLDGGAETSKPGALSISRRKSLSSIATSLIV